MGHCGAVWALALPIGLVRPNKVVVVVLALAYNDNKGCPKRLQSYSASALAARQPEEPMSSGGGEMWLDLELSPSILPSCALEAPGSERFIKTAGRFRSRTSGRPTS